MSRSPIAEFTVSRAVFEALDERPAASVITSPDREWIALLERRTALRLAEIARPFRMIGGHKVDTNRYAPHRSSRFDALSLLPAKGDAADPAIVSQGVPVWPVGFSADSRHFAFAMFHPGAIELSWVRCGTQDWQSLPNHRINALGLFLNGSLGSWVGTQSRLLCLLVPDTIDPSVPVDDHGPVVYDTRNGDRLDAWWGGMLESADDERRFRQYFTTQIATIDATTARAHLVGLPDLYDDVSASPDGQYLLVVRYVAPFARGGLLHQLSRAVEIRDARDGRTLRSLSTPGPYGCPQVHGRRWHPFEPATVVFVERSEAGERIAAMRAPFDGASTVFATTGVRRFDWTTAGRLLVWEFDPQPRVVRVRSHDAGATHLVIAQPAARRDPLAPVRRITGTSALIEEHAGAIYHADTRLESGRMRASLDRVHVETGARTRIFESSPNEYETVLGIERGAADVLLTQIEGPEAPPRCCLLDVRSGERRYLSSERGCSAIARAQRHLVEYRGTGGARLEAVVTLPEDAAPGEPLPAILWVFPEVEGHAFQASRTYLNQYPRLEGPSPLPLVTHGYAVIEMPPMPAVAARDTMVEDLIATVESLVETAVARGFIDPARLAIGGYCLGGWLAATLLAHTELFRAGVVITGSYDMTGRPMGGLWSFYILFRPRRYW